MPVRSRLDPEYSSKDLIAEMCRYAHASLKGGFDGNEHPEFETLIKTSLGVLWPITPDMLAQVLREGGTIRVDKRQT